jgi:apolipoprotein N-acyltransferase
MMAHLETRSDPVPDRRPWLWLILALAAGIFASGRWIFPPAAWLMALFALRFARTQRPWRGYLILVVTTIPAMAVGWSFFPFGGTIGLVVFCLAASLFGNLPYLIDRWLSPKAGILRTLPYPLAVVALETLAGRGDLGSWGATGYSQLGFLPMAQLASLGGLAALSFVVAWTAAVINGAWESWPTPRRERPSLVALGVVLVAVLAWGGVRLLAPRANATVRVAGIAGPRFDPFPDQEIKSRWRSGVALSASDKARIGEKSESQLAQFLAQSEIAARQGAALIAWSEAAAVVPHEQERQVLDRLSHFSRSRKVMLAASLLVLRTDGEAKWDNKLVLFTQEGEPAWFYRKAIPTPGSESAYSLRGDGVMPVHESPWARLGGAICYDADFPSLISQASAKQVDLLIVPAGDWPEVAELHASMARMRAIEQGITILRPASAGVSTVIDPVGVVHARKTQRGEELTLLVSEVPVGRRQTPYGWVGDALAVAGAVLIGLWMAGATAVSVVRRARAWRARRSSTPPEPRG